MNANNTSGTEHDKTNQTSKQEAQSNQESETQTSTSDSPNQESDKTDEQQAKQDTKDQEGVTDQQSESDQSQEIPQAHAKIIQQIEELRRLVQSEQYLNNLAARTVQLMVRSETIPRLLKQELGEGRLQELLSQTGADANATAVFDTPANIVDMVFGELCRALQSRHNPAGSVQSEYTGHEPTQAGLGEGVQPLRMPDTSVEDTAQSSQAGEPNAATPPPAPSEPTEEDVKNMAFKFVNPPEAEDDINTMILMTPTIGPNMNPESIELAFEQFDGHGHHRLIQLKPEYEKLARAAYEERRHELRFGQAYWLQLVLEHPEQKAAATS